MGSGGAWSISERMEPAAETRRGDRAATRWGWIDGRWGGRVRRISARGWDRRGTREKAKRRIGAGARADLGGAARADGRADDRGGSSGGEREHGDASRDRGRGSRRRGGLDLERPASAGKRGLFTIPAVERFFRDRASFRGQKHPRVRNSCQRGDRDESRTALSSSPTALRTRFARRRTLVSLSPRPIFRHFNDARHLSSATMSATASALSGRATLGRSSFAPSFRRAARAVALSKPKTNARSRGSLVVRAEQERLNVVMVGAECAPFSKTGGLGDVMGSLPKVRKSRTPSPHRPAPARAVHPSSPRPSRPSTVASARSCQLSSPSCLFPRRRAPPRTPIIRATVHLPRATVHLQQHLHRS